MSNIFIPSISIMCGCNKKILLIIAMMFCTFNSFAQTHLFPSRGIYLYDLEYYDYLFDTFSIAPEELSFGVLKEVTRIEMQNTNEYFLYSNLDSNKLWLKKAKKVIWQEGEFWNLNIENRKKNLVEIEKNYIELSAVQKMVIDSLFHYSVLTTCYEDNNRELPHQLYSIFSAGKLGTCGRDNDLQVGKLTNIINCLCAIVAERDVENLKKILPQISKLTEEFKNFRKEEISNLKSRNDDSYAQSIYQFRYAKYLELKHDTIANSVMTIKRGAFLDCKNLSSILIPSSVINIEENAFKGCSNLRSVVILSEVPPIVTESTFECNDTLHVLPGCKSSYKKSKFWRKFKIIEDADQMATRVGMCPTS